MSVINMIKEEISPKQFSVILIIVEMILIGAAVFLCIRPEREYAFVGRELETDYGIYLEDFLGEYGDGYYLDNSLGSEGNEDLMIQTPKTDIPRGTYEVIITYAENENLNTYTCSAKYNTYQIIYGKQHVGLDPDKNSFTVWMYSPLKITDYQMTVRFGGSGYLLVNSIVIRETKEWKNVTLFIIILISLFIDGCFLYKKYRKKGMDASARTILFLSALLVLLSSAPVLSFYLNGVGDLDLDFHLARIEALSHALMDGQIPVRLPGYWCGGYGYASSIFYGELFLYFPAALRIIGFSPQSAYKIYMLCVNGFTCLFTYYCLKKICKERLSAFMGTAVYMLAPQRLIMLHLFGAVGMYTAMVFLPVVLYGLYAIYIKEEQEGRKNGWLWLFLGFSGLIQCHVINTFIVFMFTLLVCMIKIRLTLRRDVLLQFIKAVVCTVLVNLWFLLPFLDFLRCDYKMSGMGIHSRGRFAANGTFFSQLISFFPHAEGYSISAGMERGIDVPGVEMSYTLGGGIMLALVLYVVYCFYRKREDSPIRKISDMVMGICILSLIMTTIWFPWDFLQQRSDLIAWITGSIQFPWRFLNIASVTGAFVAAFLIYELRRNTEKEFLYGAILSIGLMTLISGDYFLQDYEKQSEDSYITSDEVDSWAIGVAEYLPAGTDETTFSEEVLQQGEGIAVHDYETGEGMAVLACENIGAEETYVDVPILYYKGYAARDAGTGEYLTVVPADNKRVRVMLPAGYQGSFTVKFESPWYWRVSELISLAAIIALIFAYFFHHSRKEIVH